MPKKKRLVEMKVYGRKQLAGAILSVLPDAPTRITLERAGGAVTTYDFDYRKAGLTNAEIDQRLWVLSRRVMNTPLDVFK